MTVKQILRRALAFAFCLLTLCGAPALASNSAQCEAGGSVTLTFSVSGAYRVSGGFSYSNSDILSGVTVACDTAMSGSASSATLDYSSATGKDGLTVKLTVGIAAEAAAGESCTVAFGYAALDADGAVLYTKTESTVVTVAAARAAATAAPASPVETVYDPIDESALETYISVAESLDMSQYTAASAETLNAALENAKEQRGSGDQKSIDSATSGLQSAIGALTPMDYSSLLALTDEVRETLESDEGFRLRLQLYEALLGGEEQLQSGDQSAVDAAAERLDEALAALEELTESESSAAPATEVRVEVPVEVLPEGDYCNIALHNTWPVLFAASAALNVGLIGVMLLYVFRRHSFRDDIPIVSYDPDEDFETDNDEEGRT